MKSIFCSVLFVIASASLVAAQGVYTQIDVPGALLSVLLGINDNGVMVGGYTDAGSISHGFQLSNGVFSTIDYPGANSTTAYAINNLGQVGGTYTDQSGPNFHGFLFSGQTFTPIDVPGSIATLVLGLDDSGQIVGSYADQNGFGHGFELSNGVYSTINYPGAASSAAYSINNFGDIAGSYSIRGHNGFHSLGFIYSHRTFVRRHLRIIGATEMGASGLNDSRTLVGFYQLGTNATVQWGYRLMNNHYVRIAFPGSTSTDAIRINNHGLIVGSFTLNGIEHGFLWTPPADGAAEITPLQKRL